MSCGVGCRLGSDLMWLWLATAAPLWPLAWKLPYAPGVVLKSQKKKKKKKKKRLADLECEKSHRQIHFSLLSFPSLLPLFYSSFLPLFLFLLPFYNFLYFFFFYLNIFIASVAENEFAGAVVTKCHKPQGLSLRFLRFLEATSSEARCPWGWFLLRARRENLFQTPNLW